MNADATFRGWFQPFQMDHGLLMLRNTGGQKVNVESKPRCSCGTERRQNTSQEAARCCSHLINTGAFSVPLQDDFIRADPPSDNNPRLTVPHQSGLWKHQQNLSSQLVGAEPRTPVSWAASILPSADARPRSDLFTVISPSCSVVWLGNLALLERMLITHHF